MDEKPSSTWLRRELSLNVFWFTLCGLGFAIHAGVVTVTYLRNDVVSVTRTECRDEIQSLSVSGISNDKIV